MHIVNSNDHLSVFLLGLPPAFEMAFHSLEQLSLLDFQDTTPLILLPLQRRKFFSLLCSKWRGTHLLGFEALEHGINV